MNRDDRASSKVFLHRRQVGEENRCLQLRPAGASAAEQDHRWEVGLVSRQKGPEISVARDEGSTLGSSKVQDRFVVGVAEPTITHVNGVVAWVRAAARNGDRALSMRNRIRPAGEEAHAPEPPRPRIAGPPGHPPPPSPDTLG